MLCYVCAFRLSGVWIVEASKLGLKGCPNEGLQLNEIVGFKFESSFYIALMVLYMRNGGGSFQTKIAGSGVGSRAQ